MLEISKHFLLQLSRNNKTVEIYEKYALLFETCLTINKLTTTFNLWARFKEGSTLDWHIDQVVFARILAFIAAGPINACT